MIEPVHQQRDFHANDNPSGDGPEAPSLVTCFWCGRRHHGDHPLSVCAACKARFATMRSLEMRGFYPLNDEAIDHELTQSSPGNYALGYMDGDTFLVFYVGRSDSDVRDCLHGWVRRPGRQKRLLGDAIYFTDPRE